MYAIRLRDYHAFEVSETLTVHRIILPMKCMPEKMSYGMLKSKVDIITHLDEEPSQHIENLFLMLESRGKAWLNNEIYIQEWLINIIVTEFFERAAYRPSDVYVPDEEKVDKVMLYIDDVYQSVGGPVLSSAMSWVYFLIGLLLIGIVGGAISGYVFYQRRD